MTDVKQRTKKVMPVSPGRPKGVPNKTTQVAKDAIAQAAVELGGAERLVCWAKEDPVNERAFWTTIYPKLLPLQVGGIDGAAINMNWTIDFVKSTDER
jgi:hypothetical protein